MAEQQIVQKMVAEKSFSEFSPELQRRAIDLVQRRASGKRIAFTGSEVQAAYILLQRENPQIGEAVSSGQEALTSAVSAGYRDFPSGFQQEKSFFGGIVNITSPTDKLSLDLRKNVQQGNISVTEARQLAATGQTYVPEGYQGMTTKEGFILEPIPEKEKTIQTKMEQVPASTISISPSSSKIYSGNLVTTKEGVLPESQVYASTQIKQESPFKTVKSDFEIVSGISLSQNMMTTREGVVPESLVYQGRKDEFSSTISPTDSYYTYAGGKSKFTIGQALGESWGNIKQNIFQFPGYLSGKQENLRYYPVFESFSRVTEGKFGEVLPYGMEAREIKDLKEQQEYFSKPIEPSGGGFFYVTPTDIFKKGIKFVNQRYDKPDILFQSYEPGINKNQFRENLLSNIKTEQDLIDANKVLANTYTRGESLSTGLPIAATVPFFFAGATAATAAGVVIGTKYLYKAADRPPFSKQGLFEIGIAATAFTVPAASQMKTLSTEITAGELELLGKQKTIIDPNSVTLVDDTRGIYKVKGTRSFIDDQGKAVPEYNLKQDIELFGTFEKTNRPGLIKFQGLSSDVTSGTFTWDVTNTGGTAIRGQKVEAFEGLFYGSQGSKGNIVIKGFGESVSVPIVQRATIFPVGTSEDDIIKALGKNIKFGGSPTYNAFGSEATKLNEENIFVSSGNVKKVGYNLEEGVPDLSTTRIGGEISGKTNFVSDIQKQTRKVLNVPVGLSDDALSFGRIKTVSGKIQEVDDIFKPSSVGNTLFKDYPQLKYTLNAEDPIPFNLLDDAANPIAIAKGEQTIPFNLLDKAATRTYFPGNNAKVGGTISGDIFAPRRGGNLIYLEESPQVFPNQFGGAIGSGVITRTPGINPNIINVPRTNLININLGGEIFGSDISDNFFRDGKGDVFKPFDKRGGGRNLDPYINPIKPNEDLISIRPPENITKLKPFSTERNKSFFKSYPIESPLQVQFPSQKPIQDIVQIPRTQTKTGFGVTNFLTPPPSVPTTGNPRVPFDFGFGLPFPPIPSGMFQGRKGRAKTSRRFVRTPSFGAVTLKESFKISTPKFSTKLEQTGLVGRAFTGKQILPNLFGKPRKRKRSKK